MTEDEFGSHSVAATSRAVESENHISVNRMVLNRMVLNRMVLNRMVLNRLSDDRLAFNSLDGLETTEEGRDLLTYVARCALEEGVVLEATHEGETYEFPGLLGLAAGWEERGLTVSEGRWISACLVSHVNAYGVSVEISLRARQGIDVSAEEAEQFPVYEATFFGDLFPRDADAAAAGGDEDEGGGEDEDAPLNLYACLGGAPEVARAHAPTRDLRVCADPSPDCEVEAVGRCRDVCETHLDGVGWTDCWADGVRYTETISSFLRSEGDLCRASCGDDPFCQLRCPSSGGNPFGDGFTGGRILDCDANPGVCVAHCRSGACSLDASHSDLVLARAGHGAQTEVSCVGTDACFVECRGQGTSCDVDCTDAGFCWLERCKRGAECLLDCSGTGYCGIDRCQGERRQCANGVVVCNRDCP